MCGSRHEPGLNQGQRVTFLIIRVLDRRKIMELEQRPLGNTDIYISKLGYGCASVWGKHMISDEQADRKSVV